MTAQGSWYSPGLRNRLWKKIHHSVQKVCKIWAFNFQLDEEDWIKVVTHVVAAVWRRFTDLCLCSLYCDAKKKEYRVLRVDLHGCAYTVCVLHVGQLIISGVRVSFFQVTLFLQVPL